jgi:opacity protein-like surface antigen
MARRPSNVPSAILTAVCSALLLVPTSASAQAVAGAGIVFTDLDPFSIGLQVNGYVALPAVSGLRVGGDLTYYLPDSESDSFFGETFESDVNLFAINANAQYFFLTNPELGLYALGGLNIGRWSTSASAGGVSGSTSGTEMGLNLGAGIEYGMGFGLLYGEAKLVTGDLERFVLAAGIRIPLR